MDVYRQTDRQTAGQIWAMDGWTDGQTYLQAQPIIYKN
jgi:hypothetical protein